MIFTVDYQKRGGYFHVFIDPLRTPCKNRHLEHFWPFSLKSKGLPPLFFIKIRRILIERGKAGSCRGGRGWTLRTSPRVDYDNAESACFLSFWFRTFGIYSWGCAKGFGRGTLYMKWRASSYMALGYLGDLDWHRASARAKWTTTSHFIIII